MAEAAVNHRAYKGQGRIPRGAHGIFHFIKQPCGMTRPLLLYKGSSDGHTGPGFEVGVGEFIANVGRQISAFAGLHSSVGSI